MKPVANRCRRWAAKSSWPLARPGPCRVRGDQPDDSVAINRAATTSFERQDRGVRRGRTGDDRAGARAALTDDDVAVAIGASPTRRRHRSVVRGLTPQLSREGAI